MNVIDFLWQESRAMGVPDEDIKEHIEAMHKQFGVVCGDLSEAEMTRLRELFKALIAIRMTQGESGRQFIAQLQKDLEERHEQRTAKN